MSGIYDNLARDLAATAFNSDSPESTAETVSYTPRGDSAVDVSIIASPIDDEMGKRSRLTRSVTVLLNDNLSSPAAEDLLTIGGIDYIVDVVEDNNGVTAQLEVYAEVPISRHHEQHFKQG